MLLTNEQLTDMLLNGYKKDLDPWKILKGNKNNIPVLNSLLVLFKGLNTIYTSLTRGDGSGALQGVTDILSICFYLTLKVGHFGFKSIADLTKLLGSPKLI